ncbi:MAG: hypothetical protein M1812_001778 [Candelaria pacifica]|nr:MAG: hypothetical protein M1812_001778 [Candelaria pacifica]
METHVQGSSHISITAILERFRPLPEASDISAKEIALAISHIFTNQLSEVQTALLLNSLHYTGLDRRADVIGRCAQAMRDAAVPVDKRALREVAKGRARKEGSYKGGLCDLVGTGGDSHSTFNVSTTASIIASALLRVSKHGNRASTSKSGSADLLSAIKPIPPKLDAINPESILNVYKHSNYCFLPAPMFHTGMIHAAAVRKAMGCRTIFNLLGPLANPIESEIEARVIGVARRDLGPVFADVLVMNGAKKGMVVCGEEDLDEISCAGRTFCWRLKERPNPHFRGPRNEEDEDYTTSDDDAPPRTITDIEHFVVSPSDFGLPTHPLASASPGKRPAENAAILAELLENRRPKDDSILNFVLMNTAALFVVAGICDADSSSMGDGDNGEVDKEVGPGGGRWKEGVRRAKWAVESGESWKSLDAFIKVSNSLDAV